MLKANAGFPLQKTIIMFTERGLYTPQTDDGIHLKKSTSKGCETAIMAAGIHTGIHLKVIISG